MPATIEDVRKVVALSDMPDAHLQWIIDHCDYLEYNDGDRVAKFGDPAEVMWILLAGRIAFYMNVGGRQVYFITFENSSQSGGIGGLMPYSRMKTYPGYSYAVGSVHLLRMHKKHFPELEQLNPDLIQRLIGYMTERARTFATVQLQHEKVNALGNLAAGIAHELNNPAAAINRIANELTKRLNYNYELTKKLLDDRVTPGHIQIVQSLVEKKENDASPASKLTTMQRLNKEDEMSDWLEAKGVKKREMAETFSEYGFSIDEIENIYNGLGNDAFLGMLPWFENLLSSRKIIKDLGDASMRISNLVGSIKSHVHMDRTSDLQPTNIHQDIENTLTLLGFKLREKNIAIVKKFCNDMPVVPAYVGELNQVWTNLIDNAIGAMDKDGTLTVESSCDARDITVRIIDNGKGIPKEIISRIFEPFFTTKKVGEGTGIGLDIVNRIVKRHNGEIKVFSDPGKTIFSVCIPRTQNEIRRHDENEKDNGNEKK